MTKFFILTPTHNRATLLERAIESVRAQSHDEWEQFILDDGSKDETPQVLARAAADSRLHSWRFEKNKGVNPARNTLLDHILEKNEPGFIVILDDDDTLEKDALARFAEAAEADPERLWMIANCHFPNGDRVSQIRGAYRPLCYVRDHKLGNQLSGDVAHVFHTDLVEETRFIDSFPNAEEWWFYAGLARASPMHALDFHAKTVDYLEDGLTVLQPNKGHDVEIYARKLARFGPFLTPADRAGIEARLGRHLLAAGDRRAGFFHLRNALFHWPLEHRIYTYTAAFLFRSVMGLFSGGPGGSSGPGGSKP